MIIRTDMQRNPYYIISVLGSYWLLRRGIVREIYPHSSNAIQLYLSDEEAQNYNPDKTRELLRPYLNIVKKRTLYLPRELLLYAIEQCIFGDENERNQWLCDTELYNKEPKKYKIQESKKRSL